MAVTLENEELSRTWKIEFIGIFPPDLKSGWGAIRFLVTYPNGRTRSIRPNFNEGDIENFFTKMGRKAINKILKQEVELFKKWGLKIIEEGIDRNSLEEEPKIPTENNYEWMRKIKEGKLKPLSKKQSNNTYIYIRGRRIEGFSN